MICCMLSFCSVVVMLNSFFIFVMVTFQAVFLNVLYKSLKTDPSLHRVKVINNR